MLGLLKFFFLILKFEFYEISLSISDVADISLYLNEKVPAVPLSDT